MTVPSSTTSGAIDGVFEVALFSWTFSVVADDGDAGGNNGLWDRETPTGKVEGVAGDGTVVDFLLPSI
jgi:hypothetical protein